MWKVENLALPSQIQQEQKHRRLLSPCGVSSVIVAIILLLSCYTACVQHTCAHGEKQEGDI